LVFLGVLLCCLCKSRINGYKREVFVDVAGSTILPFILAFLILEIGLSSYFFLFHVLFELIIFDSIAMYIMDDRH
jgi:hypothetical protein